MQACRFASMTSLEDLLLMFTVYNPILGRIKHCVLTADLAGF